jgi:hypothetical protein
MLTLAVIAGILGRAGGALPTMEVTVGDSTDRRAF